MAIEWALVTRVKGQPLGRQGMDIHAGDDAEMLMTYEGPGVAVLHPEPGNTAILECWTLEDDTFGDNWFPSIGADRT